MQVFRCRTVRIGWRQRWYLAFMLLELGSLGFLVTFLSTEDSPWQPFAIVGCWFASIALLARWQRVRGHVLEIAGDLVRIRPGEGARRFFPVRREIIGASVADGYALTPSHLVLKLRTGASVDADLDSDAAQEVLDHLGVTAAQRVLRTPVFYGWLETGVDGVRIARPWGSRFMPYGTIKNVGIDRNHIVFEITSGSVQTPMIKDIRAIPTLVSRIEERRAAAARAGAPALDALERRERPVAEWRAALDELALGGKGFRGAALHDDELQRILDDPGAPLEQRIGAALALRRRGGDAQGRIRVAAESSVEPRVRVALQAAAADEMDERALERALAKAEPARSVAPPDRRD